MSNDQEYANMLAAATALQRYVDERGEPVYLADLKRALLPRSSWERFAAICVAGHRARVLAMSRIDLAQLHPPPEVTGEIRLAHGRFHWVKPRW